MFSALLLAFIKPLQHLSICYIACDIFIYYGKKNLVYKSVFPRTGPKRLFVFPRKKIFKNVT